MVSNPWGQVGRSIVGPRFAVACNPRFKLTSPWFAANCGRYEMTPNRDPGGTVDPSPPAPHSGWFRGTDGGEGRFVLQQPDLPLQTGTEPDQGTPGPNHAVAGNDDRNRIASIGPADRPTGRGLPDGPGDFLIAGGGPKRNLPQRLPDPPLKRRADRQQGQIKLSPATREVLGQLPAGPLENRARRGVGCGTICRAVAKANLTQMDSVVGHELHRPEGRVHAKDLVGHRNFIRLGGCLRSGVEEGLDPGGPGELFPSFITAVTGSPRADGKGVGTRVSGMKHRECRNPDGGGRRRIRQRLSSEGHHRSHWSPSEIEEVKIGRAHV